MILGGGGLGAKQALVCLGLGLGLGLGQSGSHSLFIIGTWKEIAEKNSLQRDRDTQILVILSLLGQMPYVHASEEKLKKRDFEFESLVRESS